MGYFLPTFGVCMLPCVIKNCVVHPVLLLVVGELWAAGPSRCPRGHETNVSSRTQSEFPK